MNIIKIIISRFFALFGYSLINLVNEEKHRVKLWSGLLPGEIRSIFQYQMFLKTLSLSGNIVECGVATGRRLSFFKNLQKEHNCLRNVWGFDSFEGFSKGHVKDGIYFNSRQDSYNQKYSTYSLDFVKKNLVSLCGEDAASEISLIKGWIPKSFDSYDGSSISLINLDVDIYEPTKETLNFFWPLLQVNGIVLLDEYDFYLDTIKFPGSKRAIDEFCKDKNISVIKHYTGKFYIQKL